MPHAYRTWAVAETHCGASISNRISDQREVHAMVSPMWLDALCVSMRNANTCAGVPGGATVKLSATRLKPPTQEPNLRPFALLSFRFRRLALRQERVSAAALVAARGKPHRANGSVFPHSCARFRASRAVCLPSLAPCQTNWSKAGSTLRSSRAVPHPSTNRALRRLTSEVGSDPVYSTRYGRQR